MSEVKNEHTIEQFKTFLEEHNFNPKLVNETDYEGTEFKCLSFDHCYRFGNSNTLKFCAILESTKFNLLYRIRNQEVLKRSTILKGGMSNLLYRIRNHNILKRRATVKSIGANLCH